MEFEDASRYHVFHGDERPTVADLRDKSMCLWNPVTGVVIDFWDDTPTAEDREGGFVVKDPAGGQDFVAVACVGWPVDRVVDFLASRPRTYGAGGDCSWARDVEGAAPAEVDAGRLTVAEYISEKLGPGYSAGWVGVTFDPEPQGRPDLTHDFDDVRDAARFAHIAHEASGHAWNGRGETLRAMRLSAGYATHADLARAVGMESAAYARLEAGVADEPLLSPDQLSSLSAHLNVSEKALSALAGVRPTTGDLFVPMGQPTLKHLLESWRGELVNGWLDSLADRQATATEVNAAIETLDAHIEEWFGRGIMDMGGDVAWAVPCPEGGHLQVLENADPGDGRAELYVEYRPEGSTPHAACRLAAVAKTSEAANRDMFGHAVYPTTLHTSAWDGHCDEPVATTCYDVNGPEALCEAGLAPALDEPEFGASDRADERGGEAK